MYKKYYVYRHINLTTNNIFYIGKGKKPKKYKSYSKEYGRAFSKNGRNSDWKKIFDNNDIKVEIIFETYNEKEALNKEIEFINIYGRKDLNEGNLTNKTDGGDTGGNIIFTDEHRNKLSKSKKGKNNPFYGKKRPKHSEWMKKEGNNHLKNKTFVEAYGEEKAKNIIDNMKEKLSGENSSMYGIKKSEEHCKNVSIGVQKAYDEGRLNREGENNTFYNKTHTEEVRKVISEKNKLAHKNGLFDYDKYKRSVICITTGKVYKGIVDVLEDHDVKYGTLAWWLNQGRNTDQFMYYSEYLEQQETHKE